MKKVRWLSLLLAVIMLLGLVPLHAAAENDVLTLTFFDKNTGDAFENPVAEKITELTGIKIEVQQPTGNPEEKLGLMLISGDLPDLVLMDRRSDMVNKYIAGGALIPLNDLIEQYAPNVKAQYGEVLNESRYEDGKNYYLNNWYGTDPDPERGIAIRMDLLKEFGYGEKAENDEYFTQEEFVDMLKQYKAKYGEDVIPFTVNGEYQETYMSTFRGMYGMKPYYEADGKLLLDVRHPRYLDMCKFVNMLYREGLLDNEWAVNKSDLFNQKMSGGNVMAANSGIPDQINTLFREEEGEETEKQFHVFNIVADGVDPSATTFNPRPSLGWDAIGITVKNEHPEETMKFIDFLASEEGQYLLMWGVEGLHWDYVDGVHVPHDDIIPGFQKDWGEYSKQTGIRKWTWFIKNGIGADGTPYDLVTKYAISDAAAHARKAMATTVYDTAPYDDVGPVAGTMEALTEQKLKDMIDQAFAKMAFASSEEEVETIYNQMITDLDANGAPDIEAIYTKNFSERVNLWFK